MAITIDTIDTSATAPPPNSSISTLKMMIDDDSTDADHETPSRTTTTSLKRILSDSTNLPHNPLASTNNKKRRLNTTPGEKPNKKKQVRFQPASASSSQDDNVHTDVYTYDRVEAEDVPNVWFLHNEMQHSRYYDGQWIQCYAYYDPYVNDIWQLLGMACGKVQTNYTVATDVADALVRGLEREISPCFRQRKRQVIANVLHSQSKLQTWQDKHGNTAATQDFASKILSEHYHKLARPASRFARLLAVGDANVVELEDKEEDEEAPTIVSIDDDEEEEAC